MNDNKLKIWFNDTDWVVAESDSEAMSIWLEWTGEQAADYASEMIWTEWDKPLQIHDYDGSGDIIERDPSHWIAVNGKGVLCTTEY